MVAHFKQFVYLIRILRHRRTYLLTSHVSMMRHKAMKVGGKASTFVEEARLASKNSNR